MIPRESKDSQVAWETASHTFDIRPGREEPAFPCEHRENGVRMFVQLPQRGNQIEQ
jgi:hypothetical protein